MSGPEQRVGGPVADDRARVFTAAEVEQIANETSDSLGNLYRLDFIDRIRHEAEVAAQVGEGATLTDAELAALGWTRGALREDAAVAAALPTPAPEAPAGEGATLTDWLAAELRRHSPLTFTQARDAAERIAPSLTQRGGADQATLAAVRAELVDTSRSDALRVSRALIVSNEGGSALLAAIDRDPYLLDGTDAGGGRRG